MQHSKLCTTFRNEVSENGYKLDVLKSGLQKYIRRNIYNKAIYCAFELDSFAIECERVRTNFIHRLMIIFMEDISIGNYLIWDKLNDNFQLLFNERKKINRNRNIELNVINNIVINLCNSNKIRICSFIRAYITATNLPDGLNLLKKEYKNREKYITFNLNKDILKKEIIELIGEKDFNGFYYIYNCIENKYLKPKDIFDIYKLFNIPFIDIAYSWYKEIKTQEQFITWMLPLAWHIFGNPADCSYYKITPHNEYKMNTSPITFDDYVYDKHTKNSLNNTSKYFALTSSMVIPEIKLSQLQIELKILYEYQRSLN